VQQSNDARHLVGIVVDPELRILRACRFPHVGQGRVRDGPVVERETVGSTLRDRLVEPGQAANVRLAAAKADRGDEREIVWVGQQTHPRVVTQVLCGDPQVEQGRTAADQQGTPGGVRAGQLPRRVRVDPEVAVVDLERPGLGVVQRGGRRGRGQQDALVRGRELNPAVEHVHRCAPSVGASPHGRGRGGRAAGPNVPKAVVQGPAGGIAPLEHGVMGGN
jgi:hypothetical protein